MNLFTIKNYIAPFCFMLSTGFYTIQAEPKKEKIILTNSVIKALDGAAFCFDGQNIGNMKYMKGEIIKLQQGKNPKTGEFNPAYAKYSYNDKKYTLRMFALYEKKLEAELEQKKKDLDRKYITRSSGYCIELEALEQYLKNKLQEELLKGQEQIRQTAFDEPMYAYEEEMLKITVMTKINEEREQQKQAITRKHVGNLSAYDKELHEITHEFRSQVAPLHKILDHIKLDFLNIIHPFMEQAHGVKGALLILIEESCIKRGRWDSFLLKWGKAKEAEEIDVFNNYMSTFQRLDTFCTDLCNFLTDIINSCPKGAEQFKLLYAKNQEKNS